MKMQRGSEPKYVHLKNVIRDWVNRGELRPGDQIPTEWTLAEQFGMSRQTVRTAVNELVFENILIRQQGRGTFVAQENSVPQPMGSVRFPRTVAVVTTYLTDYIFPSIIEGIESRLSERGFSILLFNTENSRDKEAVVLNRLLQQSVDGIIVEPTRSAEANPNLHLYLHLFSRGIPVVTLHSGIPELAVPGVRMNDEAGGRLAGRHLLELGHQRIGAIMKMDDMQGRLRLRGLLATLQRNDTAIVPDYVHCYNTDSRQQVAMAYGEKWLALSESERPTGIVCYNDQIATDLKHILVGQGVRVPEDVSIVGFDDSHFAALSGVTSVQHPKRAMGERVADELLKWVHPNGERQQNTFASRGEALDVVFEPALIIRESTHSI